MNLFNYHGQAKNNHRTVIIDEDPNKNFNLTVNNYSIIPNNIVEERLTEFDSYLVLAHFNPIPIELKYLFTITNLFIVYLII